MFYGAYHRTPPNLINFEGDPESFRFTAQRSDCPHYFQEMSSEHLGTYQFFYHFFEVNGSLECISIEVSPPVKNKIEISGKTT